MDTSQNTLTQQELDEVIQQHSLWLETDEKEGQRADLSGQRLVGLNLSGADLDNTDITVARNWQQAIGISTGPIDNLSQKLQQQNQEIEQLKAELEAAKASEQADEYNAAEINRLQNKLKQLGRASIYLCGGIFGTNPRLPR